MPEKTEPTNRLLAALPEKEYRRIFPKLERVALQPKQHIYNPGDLIEHVYFPESGIVSLLAAVEKHSMLEVGIVGSEGFVGSPVFLGVKNSNNLTLVQGAGFAARLTTKDFLEECARGGEFPKILQRFIQSLITQISQSAACFRFHPIESRLARWLLMTSDRMRSDDFQITQEFLSNMLGVRREGVTIAARNLRQQELIQYNRGNLSIIDRQKLETTACSCYEIIKKAYDGFSRFKS